MGYIAFGDPKKFKPRDPRFMRIFIVSLVIFLILLMTKIKVFGIELSSLWGGLLIVAIGLFALFAIVGIVLYQTKVHYPDFFDKLPEQIKKIAE